MANWEYRKEAYKIAEAWQSPDLSGLRELEGLNKMGSEGWEVVSFIDGPGNHFSYLLKREVS